VSLAGSYPPSQSFLMGLHHIARPGGSCLALAGAANLWEGKDEEVSPSPSTARRRPQRRSPAWGERGFLGSFWGTGDGREPITISEVNIRGVENNLCLHELFVTIWRGKGQPGRRRPPTIISRNGGTQTTRRARWRLTISERSRLQRRGLSAFRMRLPQRHGARP
jgi:hypothetical protein